MILLAVISAIASCEPQDYDTYLYHAQSIKWIEQFGAVKGLANLHPRFGYNSAYMCFQALFSLSFTGRSLHQSNGFMVLIMLFYALTDNYLTERRKPDTSDLLKGSMVFYTIYALDSISSSGTDIFPMLTLLYIFSKWVGISKEDEHKASKYGLLCMLAVFCATVKLSIAPVVLLSVYPVYLLIKNGEIKKLLGFILTAVFIGLPYIIRNVILTGYLVYPMEKLDLFNVDWKVATERVFTDRIEIELYAKSMSGLELKEYPLKEWVQSWYRNLLLVPRILFFLAVILFVYAMILMIRQLIAEKKADLNMFTTVIAAVSFLYWFFMAPNMRYGIVNLLLISSLVTGLYMDEAGKKAFTAMLLVCCIMVFSEKSAIVYTQTNLVYPDDYKSFECEESYYKTPEGNSVTVYVPKEGDQSGVDVFPEAPVVNPEYEMLRGESLKDGFMPIPKEVR